MRPTLGLKDAVVVSIGVADPKDHNLERSPYKPSSRGRRWPRIRSQTTRNPRQREENEVVGFRTHPEP